MPRSISIAMIVKDEADQLRDCLASVAGLANEICIVDTGSSDNTVEIAKELSAKVSFFIWCDDFAAARNESLRLCTGDWIFVLDADERLVPEDIARIKALVEGPADKCYRFVTRNYTNTNTVAEFESVDPATPLAKGFAGWYPSTKVRLFPNRVGGRFEGKVHEMVNGSLQAKGLQPVLCDIPIHHYPFTKAPDRILSKQEMYLRLGLRKVELNPQDPNAHAELGNQYAEMQDHARAATAYKNALRHDPSNPVVLKDLGGMLHLLKHSEEAKRALRLSIELDPGQPEAWRNLGVIFADEKEWDLAVECFTQGLQLSPGWLEGQRYLSVALEGAGRLVEASEASREALRLNPDAPECLSLFIHQMLRLERRSDARQALGQILDAGGSHPELQNALGELYYYDELFNESVRHFQSAGEGGIAAAFNNLGVVLYRLQRYAEAKEAFERCLAGDPGHRGAQANLQKSLAHLRKA